MADTCTNSAKELKRGGAVWQGHLDQIEKFSSHLLAFINSLIAGPMNFKTKRERDFHGLNELLRVHPHAGGAWYFENCAKMTDREANRYHQVLDSNTASYS